MRSFLRKKLTELRQCKSGNALMLVALGMPVLIGGTGVAVDTAQWYMWKGELQYAVDQRPATSPVRSRNTLQILKRVE